MIKVALFSASFLPLVIYVCLGPCRVAAEAAPVSGMRLLVGDAFLLVLYFIGLDFSCWNLEILLLLVMK